MTKYMLFYFYSCLIFGKRVNQYFVVDYPQNIHWSAFCRNEWRSFQRFYHFYRKHQWWTAYLNWMHKNNDIGLNSSHLNNLHRSCVLRPPEPKTSVSDVSAQFYQKKIRKKQIFRAFPVEKLSQLINYNRKQPNERKKKNIWDNWIFWFREPSPDMKTKENCRSFRFKVQNQAK